MSSYRLTQTGAEVQELLDKVETLKIKNGTITIGEDSLTPVTTETDPTVPSWAKSERKPSYELSELGDDSTHRTVTDAEKATWNAKSDFSGDYRDLTHQPDLSQFVTRTVNNLLYYYRKGEVYNREEITQLLSTITTGVWQVVPELPVASEATYGMKIYLVPSSQPQSGNVKDEYITVKNGNVYSWEQIGSTAIDLSDYVTNEDLQDALEDYVSSEAFRQALAGKQDTLVSGTNIKTVNGENILGSGNIVAGDPNAVKYIKQTLTDAQKTQARTNIGAGTYSKSGNGIPETDLAQAVVDKLNAEEIFIATYGTTTQAQVQAAASAGKVVVCFYGSRMYVYAGESAAGYSQFTSVLYDKAYRVYLKNSSWGSASYDLPIDAVLYTTQNLSDSQKSVARGNIGAGTYSKPDDGIPGSDIAAGVIPDVSQFITKSVNDLVNYYTKSQTYTQTEVNSLIGAIQQFHYEIVATLPATGAGNILYLLGPTGTGADKYEEYVYANSTWTKIGDTSIDLSGYVTTTALNTALAAYTTTANLTTLLAGKQDTINDLADIRSGAAAGATAYQKPSGGIPKSDLASAVQTSLGKADTALQSFTETDPTVPAWAKAANPPTEVFIAEYNVTPFADIYTAYQAGKSILVEQGGTFAVLTDIGSSSASFAQPMGAGKMWECFSVSQTGGWSRSWEEIVDVTNLSQLSDDATHRLVTDTEKATWNAKYDKPSTGIPASDLASGVIPDVSGYLPLTGGKMDISAEIDWTESQRSHNARLGADGLGFGVEEYEQAHYHADELRLYDYNETSAGGLKMSDGDLVIYDGGNEYALPIGSGTLALTSSIPSTYAGSPSAGGPANKTLAIPFGAVDAGSTATAITATVDNFPTTLTDGVCAYIRNDVVASASGWTLNINGTGAKPVYASNADASRTTTVFSAASTFLFVYNSSRVSGGCWDVYYGYDSNTNTIGYNLRTGAATPPTASKFYRYRILFTSQNGQSLIPANTSSSTNATAARAVNQAKIDPFGPIFYYSTTAAVDANASVGASYAWLQYSGIALGYSFNRTGAALTMTAKDPVFLKCAPQADGSAIMDADTPIVQALPSTEDGKIYIYLGIAESATAITLYYWHPIYWYKDGAIRQWTNAAGGSSDEALSSSEIQDIWDDVMN